ncbi:hypothetical protein D3C76_869250 [compost metagenome]
MGRYLAAQAMGFLDHLMGFFGGERRDDFAVRAAVGAVHGDLDQVYAILGLLADFCQGFAAAGDQACGEIFRGAHAAGKPVIEALAIGDDPAAGRDARTLEQARGNCIAHGDAELAAIAWANHAGHPSGQHMLSEEHAAQGAEFVAGPDIDVFFALRVAEGQVCMHVHQTRHDKVIAGVHNAVTCLWLRCHGCRADVCQQAVLHHQGLLLAGLQAGTVEQGLAFEVQGIHGVFTLRIVMQSEARARP